MLDGISHSPAYFLEVTLLERLAGPAAAEALRAPFILGDRKTLTGLFEEGGLSSPRVETLQGIARFPNVRIMVEADLHGWLPVMGVMLSEQQIDRILAEAEREFNAFVKPSGEVVFEVSAHIAIGRKQG